jgi:Ca-activated chloride channel homolog
VPSYVRFLAVVIASTAPALAWAQGSGPSIVPTSTLTPHRTPATTFRSQIDLVALTVTVTDAKEQYVRGLTAADFTVLEEGVAQPVSFFGIADVPLDLAMVVDASASMAAKMPAVQLAALGLLKSLKSGDRASLVEFRDQIVTGQEFTENLDIVGNAVRAMRPKGGTSLYNALYVTLREFQKLATGQHQIRRKAIVVLSDGEDTGSLITFDDVVDLARRTGATIYTISLRSDYERQRARSGRQFFSPADFAMRSLAEETGARAFFPTCRQQVRDVYDAIAAELASQYAIGYMPSNPIRDSAWRRIAVQVASRPGIRSRTRTGYFAETGSRIVPTLN